MEDRLTANSQRNYTFHLPAEKWLSSGDQALAVLIKQIMELG